MTARTPEEQRRFEEQGKALDELTREFYEAGHYDISEDWLAEQRERIERRYPTLGQIEHFYVPHCNHLDGNPEPPQSTERGAKHDR